MSKLFVGSLSWGVDSDSLREAFSAHGEVTDSFVCRDRETGRSRGFGFITYATEDEAIKAMEAMNGSELDGRQIKVDRASDRPSGGNGGGGGRSGGYGGGRGDGGYGGGRSGGYGGDRNEGGYGGGRSGGYGNSGY